MTSKVCAFLQSRQMALSCERYKLFLIFMGLLDFFKSKSAKTSERAVPEPIMADLEQNPLQEGDIVECLRYEMGQCRLQKTENGYEYESLETGERVSWLRMIDAATQLQKVKKIKK